MITKSGKIWGENILIFNNDAIQINQIYINRGGRCSKHKHEYKSNMFFVQKGVLQIEEWQDNGLVDITVLNDNQSILIPINTFHRFTALEDTMALEIYFPPRVLEEDIIRQDTGTLL